MNPDAEKDLLDKVFALSSEMLRLAKSEQWEEVIQLQSIREDLLAKLELQSSEFEAQSLVDYLAKILEINEQIESLSRDEMKLCLSRCADVKRNKKAFEAYSTI